MALTAAQQASRLFKKLMGVAETSTLREFFQEPHAGKQMVLPSQIWTEAQRIPGTSPNLEDGETDEQGIVQYFENKVLQPVPGTNNSFFHEDLVDAIPFNFGDGTYNYQVFNSSQGTIPFGQGDWVVDGDAGVLTFYGTVPSNMPPSISYYKYVGPKGLGAQYWVENEW